MPSVEISTTVAEPLELPHICVKSGVPTADTVTIRGSAEPAWTGGMILFGFLAWMLASRASARRDEITIPLRGERFRRYRDWKKASWALAALGIVLTVVAAVLGRDAPYLPLALTAIGFALGLVNELVNSVGVRLGREGALVLTRVHPAFRDALLGSHSAR